MNWETNNSLIEETKIQASDPSFNGKMEQEQNQDEITQLKKFQDPTKNLERQSILTLLTQFGHLFTTLNISDTSGTINNIFKDDCQFFQFGSAGRTPPKHCLHPKDFHNFYLGMQIKERIVRETYIDAENMTAIQWCNFKILYQGETDPVANIVVEVFAIKDAKISKYRAFYAPSHEGADPFEITRKDRALAMLKQVNYALADNQPDLEKVTTMFHENIKYKIWSWDSQKYFMLEKGNFVESFKNMQQNLVIKSIVPYGMYTESQAVVGTYVYHLEGVDDKYTGKKYVWLCTCLYVFDDDYKIIRVSQQGELYQEGEVYSQFEVYSREKLIRKVESIFVKGPTIDLFYGDILALNCTLYAFGSQGGSISGTGLVDITSEQRKKSIESPSRAKLIDKSTESYFDCSDYSYDVIIFIHTLWHRANSSVDNPNPIEKETIHLTMYKFEHGKIIKVYALQVSSPSLQS